MLRKIKIIILSGMLLFPLASLAQQIKGVVLSADENNEPLVAAVVAWEGQDDGVVSDKQGAFTIARSTKTNRLVASYIGYDNDTITVDNNTNEVEFWLSGSINLESVVVSGGNVGTMISMASINKKEIITFAGLCKMACCNLAESFENTASVTVGYSDAVSGARQIKMLGLAGIYTQMLDENRPTMRGITSPYGLTFTPGMWLKGIQMSKGVTSVVNGYEGLTGQINVEHRKPTDQEPLFVNAFLGDDLRTELNVTSALQINDKLSTVVLAHGAIDPLKIDHNNDGFLDMPLRKNINIANRWLYVADNGIQIRGGIRGLYEKREGGQKKFTMADRNTLNAYGSVIENKLLNAYVKVGVPLKEEEPCEDLVCETSDHQHKTKGITSSNIALVTDYVYQAQNSFFGLKDYDGQQNSFFANLMYQMNAGEKHTFIVGGSMTADLFKESLIDRYNVNRNNYDTPIIQRQDFNFDRNEYTVGVFSEYTYRLKDRLDVVAGVRLDHNNQYGLMFTPRFHLKWNIIDNLTFRGVAGMGYRSANIITDNTATVATGRRLVISDSLDRMERSFTYGGSLIKSFTLFGRNASVGFDYFRSQFINQVVVDQEQSQYDIEVYNLDGKSFTDTYQIDFNFIPLDRLTFYLTYRYNNTKIDLHSYGRVQTPLIDRFKGLVNVQYATRFNKWIFDFTAQINGQSRLPVQNAVMNDQSVVYSPIYPMFFAQVTRKLGKKTEVYLGCENIANYKQKNPIISPNLPFSHSFNSTLVWGPIMGRKFYTGVRFTL